MTPNINLLSKMIRSESIKIVSFDIFDTLIIRPVINPKDVFVFLDNYFTEITGRTDIKFSEIRISCENILFHEVGVENVTIDMIYEKIFKNYNLVKSTVSDLKEKEFDLEYDLSNVNKEILNVLTSAKRNGKRILLLSDMYLSSKNISIILDKFNIEYDSLYISADLKKRKDKGDLYDEIIQAENCQPYEFLHIGDNKNSDFLIPLKKGILAFHYKPHYLQAKNQFSLDFTHNSEITSIFIGYLLNEELSLISTERMKYTNIFEFGYYSLAPIILSITLKILFSKEIQESYDTLLFASRDGYLPFHIYELLRKATGRGIPGKYIYCGRRALNIVHYNNSVLNYITDTLFVMDQIAGRSHSIKDSFIALNLENYYIEPNNFYEDKSNIEYFISDNNLIVEELDRRKNNTIQYFSNLLNDAKNAIIFDCGYSGTLSDSISKLTGKNTDKIYMWDIDINKAIDKKNNTKTFILLDNFDKIRPFNLIFEELFSPLEPSCIGYENIQENILPKFDKEETFSEAMINDLNQVHNAVMQFTNKFLDCFLGYLKYFSDIDLPSVFNYAMNHLFNENDESLSLLKNIVFYDKFCEGNNPSSLSNKLYTKNYNNSCKGSILISPKMLYQNNYSTQSTSPTYKIGIHIHLYYIDLYIDFLEKLINFPFVFDLYITCSDNTHPKMLYNVFSRISIPLLNEIKIINVPNQGRDLAPWLIDLKSIQKDYDIFGHFHSKKNEKIGFADEWRSYLLYNLLEEKSVIDIINLFYLNKNIGIVYPPMYKNVYQSFISASDPPFQELDIISSFLSKIELPQINNCNEIPFSVGTMFWYRPSALEKFFNENLSYNDFPIEPIGINGTLAHAIERLPSYIASIAGYNTKLYLNPITLTKVFFDSYRKPNSNNNVSFSSLELSIDESSFKPLLKKLFSIVLKFIPGRQNKTFIDILIRNKLYSHIKQRKLREFSDGTNIYKNIHKGNITSLKEIKLTHWVGFLSNFFYYTEKFIYISGAWAIDYINQSNYSSVFMKVNGIIFSTNDHLQSVDVAKYFRNAHYLNSGFSFSFPIEILNIGVNNFSALVVLCDYLSYYETNTVSVVKSIDGKITI